MCAQDHGRTCPGLDELSSGRGAIVDAEPHDAGSSDCESGDARILSFRRVDGTGAPAASARGRFFAGCKRLGFIVPSDESCIRQSTAPSASSSMSVDCTWVSAAAAAARLGELGEVGSSGAAAGVGATDTGSWVQRAFAADKLSNERALLAMGGVISSGPSARTNPFCVCRTRTTRRVSTSVSRPDPHSCFWQAGKVGCSWGCAGFFGGSGQPRVGSAFARPGCVRRGPAGVWAGRF